MARRFSHEVLGNTVQKAMQRQLVATETLSEATDLPVADLNARLYGVVPFTVGELAKVGGFLRIPASVLTEGAHA